MLSLLRGGFYFYFEDIHFHIKNEFSTVLRKGPVTQTFPTASPHVLIAA